MKGKRLVTIVKGAYTGCTAVYLNKGKYNVFNWGATSKLRLHEG